MMIKRLFIKNFRNYFDENEFDWSLSSKKNVILIGGMNGAGKTTMADAIKLCLYGYKMNGTPMSDNVYNEYVKEVWSWGRKNEPMRIEMDVVIDTEKPAINMTIARTFKNNRGKISEELSLTKDGKEVELIDRSYWELYVSKILPPHLSRYFFFDGERVRDTISSNNSFEYLSNAVRDLTGVSKLDLLKTDLFEVKKRISRTNIKPSVDKKIKSMEAQIETLKSSVETLNSSLQDLLSEKEKLVKEKSSLDDEFNRALGTKEKQNTKLKKDIESKKQKYSELNDYVQDFIYSHFHKIICANIMKSVLVAAKSENDNNLSSIGGEFLKERVAGLKKSVKKLDFDKTFIDSVLKVIDSEFKDVSNSKNKFSDPIIDLTYSQIDSIAADVCTDDEKSLFVNRLRDREKLSIEITKLEKEQSHHSDESVSVFETKLGEIQSKISDLDKSIIETEAYIKSKNNDIESLEKEIYNEEKSLIVSTRDSLALSIIDEAIAGIDIRADVKLTDCLIKLESDINEMYKKLKNKKDMVKKIIIQPDYSLKLVGFDGNDVSIKFISEGEKGILMYSVMYGLLNISESKLPLIIDSPLGRMDSEHVEHLIKHLYPIFGDQVIVLSHDREITPDVLPLLDSVLSKTLLLQNKKPKIINGYFEVKHGR